MPYLVQEQGKDNRRGKTKKKIIKADKKSIPYQAVEIRAIEEPDKMLKPHPGTSKKPAAGRKILEGDKRSVHGLIAEKGVEQDNRYRQNVERPIPLHVLTEHF
jgi:hypothetical protein